MTYPLKLRLKIFNKLAQVQGAPPSPPSPTAPTTPTEPTSTSSNVKKSSSQPASSMMNMPVGWPNWVSQINELVKKVDAALIAGTNQKYNFNDLFQSKFPSGAESEFASPAKDIVIFGRLIYQQIMNNGFPYHGKLQNGEMRKRINILLGAPSLQKFQQVNPASPLGALGVNLSNMRADLLALYNSIPAA